MRFFGSRGLSAPPGAWQDHVFSHALPFYLFDLPFYSDLLGFLFVVAILSALLFWVTARGWQLFERVRYRLIDRPAGPINIGDYLRLPGATRTPFFRIIAVILLLGFAAWVYLGNYELLFNAHAFMTGADFVDEKVTLPSALAPHYLCFGGPAAGLDVEVQAGCRPGDVLLYSAIGCACHGARRIRAAE